MALVFHPTFYLCSEMLKHSILCFTVLSGILAYTFWGFLILWIVNLVARCCWFLICCSLSNGMSHYHRYSSEVFGAGCCCWLHFSDRKRCLHNER